jgi:nucleoside-diphosphate-sugar epimerase
VDDPWVYVDANMTGTLTLLELTKKYKITHFVQASTSSIYGANPPLPTNEEADSNHPLQSYAASKKGAETLCHAYHHLYGINMAVFRYFTVYGPAGRPDMVMFRFCQWINENKPVAVTGDGKQTRGFTFVDDIARGTILGLGIKGYEVINLGGHETISILELIHFMEEAIGKKATIEFIERHPADADANWADISKAKELLNWEPQIELREGIKRTCDWYAAERAWVKDILTE